MIGYRLRCAVTAGQVVSCPPTEEITVIFKYFSTGHHSNLRRMAASTGQLLTMKRELSIIYYHLAATILFSIVTCATASAQAPIWNPHTNKALERYDNPPAPSIYRLETSPRMVSPYGGFISYQVNVDANGNNIVGDAANECSISVDPTNGSRMAIGCRQFNNVTSNFRRPTGCHRAVAAQRLLKMMLTYFCGFR